MNEPDFVFTVPEDTRIKQLSIYVTPANRIAKFFWRFWRLFRSIRVDVHWIEDEGLGITTPYKCGAKFTVVEYGKKELNNG